MNKMEEIEDLWKFKKGVEKYLESKKQELQSAIDEKDDTRILKYEKEIESLEKLIKQRDDLINEKLKEYLEEKKTQKKEKSKVKKSAQKNIVKENEEKDKIQIFFDMVEGQYKCRYKDVIKSIDIYDENGSELISEQDKSDIETEISELVSNKEVVKKVDPYIFKILEEVNIKKRDEYVKAIEDSTYDLNGVEIAYDFRTRENGKKREQKVKTSFLQKRKMKKMAKIHQKNKLAQIFKDKSRGLLYGLLAGLGITMLGAGSTYVNDVVNKNPQQMESESENNIEEEPIIIIYNKDQIVDNQTEINEQVETQEQSDVNVQTEVQKETEQSAEVQKETEQSAEVQEEKETEKQSDLEQEVEENEQKVGGFVTVRLGAHIYSDPFDAVKEQLKKQPNEKVIVKSKNEDRVYKVTKEVLYCPDGTCITIDNGDLKTAMQGKGMDVKILENIDSEELESLGYKRMLHVVAEGIAQWVEEGDTLQLEVDKFGNRIEKTSTEKENSKQEIQQTTEKEGNVR